MHSLITTQKIVIGVLFLVLGIGGVLFLWQGRPEEQATSNVSASLEQPFEGIVIPSDIEEAARAIIQEKIDGTRAMYEESPKIWETWIAIGNMYGMVRDYERAIVAYQKSIELQYNNILAFGNIAVVYENDLKDYEKSAQYYRLAINNNFSNPAYYVSLGRVQWKHLKQKDEAEKTYLEGIARTNGHPDILTQLILFYEDIGEKGEKYTQAVKKLIENNPDNSQYKERWGNVLQ